MHDFFPRTSAHPSFYFEPIQVEYGTRPLCPPQHHTNFYHIDPILKWIKSKAALEVGYTPPSWYVRKGIAYDPRTPRDTEEQKQNINKFRDKWNTGSRTIEWTKNKINGGKRNAVTTQWTRANEEWKYERMKRVGGKGIYIYIYAPKGQSGEDLRTRSPPHPPSRRANFEKLSWFFRFFLVNIIEEVHQETLRNTKTSSGLCAFLLFASPPCPLYPDDVRYRPSSLTRMYTSMR